MAELIEKQEIKAKDLAVETKESHKKNSERTLKIVSVIIGTFLIIAIILIKIANPEMSWKFPIIFIIIVFIIAILIFFSFEIARKLGKEKLQDLTQKLPVSANLPELRFMAEEILVSAQYANHIKKIIEEKNIYIGKDNKNKIYIMKAELLYKALGTAGIAYIIINTHDIKNTINVLIDPSIAEVNKTINQTSSNPDDEKDLSEETIWNPITNTYVQHKKYEKPKTKEEIKKKKEEDL